MVFRLRYCQLDEKERQKSEYRRLNEPDEELVQEERDGQEVRQECDGDGY